MIKLGLLQPVFILFKTNPNEKKKKKQKLRNKLKQPETASKRAIHQSVGLIDPNFHLEIF